jgi:uncharacterized membrane protein/Uri superfamily endonuclease
MSRSIRYTCLACLLAAGLIIRIILVRSSAPFDDAYITFRYVENLAAGHGFVYNVGEHVLGTTTPLFALILTPFTIAGAPTDAAALVLSVILDLSICALLYVFLRKTTGEATAIAVSLFYALSYAAVAACGYGMETQLFVLLVLVSIGLAARDNYPAAAAAAGLAVLTRPEGFVLTAMLGISMFIRYRAKLGSTLKPVLIFTAVAAPWFIFAAVYFGTPLPNSVTAKLAQTDVSTRAWLNFFVTRNPLVMLLWLGAAIGFVTGLVKRNELVILVGIWGVLHTIFFFFARPPFWLGHYFAPTAMSIVVLSAVGAATTLGWLLRSPARGAGAAALVWIVIFVVVFPRSLNSARWNKVVADRVFRPMATWIERETPEDVVVHASDIGYLGYYSRRYIMDAAALVTPDVGRYFVSHADEPNWDVDYVLENRPEIVVLPVRAKIIEKFTGSEFASYYEPVVRYQATGETDLHPPAGTGDRYARDARFIADYIAYSLVTR